MDRNGHLFVFEGPDQVGKTSIALQVAEHLKAAGRACEYASFPGNTPGSLGELVYRLHHSPSELGLTELNPTSCQLLHIAAHIDTIAVRILPALQAGRCVLLDRFWWSTWVYGVTAGVESSALRQMIEIEQSYWGQIVPSCVFLIRRNPEGLQLHQFSQRLTREYSILAAREARKYRVLPIDNDASIAEAIERVVRAVLSSEERPQITDIRSSNASSNGQFEFGPVPNTPKTITAICHLTPAKSTIVFDTYWRFAAERQAVFFRRFRGQPAPWTDDLILRAYKFTNAYRASDRVSQYLIRHVIYRGDQSPEELFFRIILFKFFNRIDTWELLLRELGQVTYQDYSFERYDYVLSHAMDTGHRLYSAAYIMPSGRSVFGFDRKHRTHLKLLERMMEDEVPLRVADAPSMRRVFDLLLSYPTMGPFLAFQYATDLNYSTVCDFKEMDFVVPGPGALDGIRKCFSDLGGLDEADVIRLVADQQETFLARLGLDFQSLWGRRLQLIDCQNLFCEVDKYARVAHPNVKGRSGRVRIKQKYVPTSTPIQYWYPPKWGLNVKIEKGNVHDAPICRQNGQ